MREPVHRPSSWYAALRAVLDEGLFGLSHLLVHFYLASVLEPVRYGAFALAMVWGLLGASAHQAFLVEPLLVARAAAIGREPGYLRAVLGLHWGLTLPVAALAALLAALPAVGGALRAELAASAVLVLGIAMVRLTRGMAYAELPSRVGTFAVASYAGLTALGLGILAYFHATSGPRALLVLGAAGCVGSSAALWRARLASGDPRLWRRALAYHWQQGRWLLALSPLRWGLDSLPIVILGSARGLADVALLRAAVLVVAPAVQVVGALRMMLIPRFVEAMEHGRLRSLLWRSQLALAAATLTFALVISLCARDILALVARQYTGADQLLPLVSATPGLLGAALLFGNVLRARGRTQLSARAFAIGSGVAAIAALLLCEPYGSLGAALALALGYGALLASKGLLALLCTESGARGSIETARSSES